MGSSIKFDIEMEGLDTFANKIEELRDERTVYQLNRKIVKYGQQIGQDYAKTLFPRSSNLRESGPKHATSLSRTVPEGHAADNIPVDKIVKSGLSAYGFIGFRPADTSLNFYGKFFEEGAQAVRTRSPKAGMHIPAVRARHIFETTEKQVESRLAVYGRELYEKKLREVIGD